MNYLLLGVIMIGGPAVYAMTGVFVSRKLLHGRVQEGHNDVCVPVFLNAGVFFAVLLGFMVIAVWESMLPESMWRRKPFPLCRSTAPRAICRRKLARKFAN
jgi:hypothetical protein